MQIVFKALEWMNKAGGVWKFNNKGEGRLVYTFTYILSLKSWGTLISGGKGLKM